MVVPLLSMLVDLERGRLHGSPDVGDAAERALREIDAHVDVGDRVVEAVERGESVAQSDHEAAVEPDAGIGVRLLAGAELTLQVVELATHLDQRLHAERRSRADAGDAHADPHIFNSGSSMSLTVDSTRALAA